MDKTSQYSYLVVIFSNWVADSWFYRFPKWSLTIGHAAMRAPKCELPDWGSPKCTAEKCPTRRAMRGRAFKLYFFVHLPSLLCSGFRSFPEANVPSPPGQCIWPWAWRLAKCAWQASGFGAWFKLSLRGYAPRWQAWEELLQLSWTWNEISGVGVVCLNQEGSSRANGQRWPSCCLANKDLLAVKGNAPRMARLSSAFCCLQL